MYKSFRVKNFRCFKDLQINDLGRVNLIAGKNNTGKTALLEAMYLLSGNRSLKTLLRRSVAIRTRFSREEEEDARSSISWGTVFSDFDKSSPIEITAGNVGPEKTDSSKITLNIRDVPDPAMIEDEAFLDTFHRYYSDFDLDLEVLEFDSSDDDNLHYLFLQNGYIRRTRFELKNVVPANFLYSREKMSPKITSDRFTKLQDSKEIDELISGLRIIEDRLIDLRIGTEDGRPSINADINLPKLVSLSTLGDGMNRVADLLLAMHEAKGGVILVDEIENGLHYTIHKAVWKLINEMSIDLKLQVFATTHSYEMIEAAHEAFKDDDPYEFRFHRLDRNSETGEIEAVTYNQAGVNAFTNINYEVRG